MLFECLVIDWLLEASTSAVARMLRNAKIQALEKRACDYRNRARFRAAILFHCGGLDRYPRLAHAHTKS